MAPKKQISKQSRQGLSFALSRRNFLKMALISTAAAAGFAVPNIEGCSGSFDRADFDILIVNDDEVVTLDAFTQIKNPEKYCDIEKIATFDNGTMLFSNSAKYAAALQTSDNTRILTTLALVDLSSGELTTVRKKPLLYDDGYNITSAICSNSSLVWVESNYLSSDWAIFSASFKKTEEGFSCGAAIQLDSGDADYDVPEIAICGRQIFWIVQPSKNSSLSSKTSELRMALGKAVSTLYSSIGRFNGALYTSKNTLTAMPRVDTSSGVYYQLTSFLNGRVVAKEVLPRSYQPASAIRVRGEFAFSIPASYDYGGGIANVGTYYPMPNGQWLRLSRTPVTPPGFCKGWLFCKSGSRTVFVDLVQQRYFTIPAPDNTEDQGDYSVRFGSVPHVDNYATVTTVKGSLSQKSVVLRRITPIDIRDEFDE